MRQFPLAVNIAICDKGGMSDSNALLQQLLTAGVSPSYASEISRGVRTPGLQTAIKIYRTVGVKLGPIANASKAEIAVLEKIGAKRVSA